MEEPFEIVIRNVLDNRITIQPKASIGLTLQPTAGNVVNITKKDNVSVGLVNKENIAVTINTRVAQGSGTAIWGGITGTITNQTDLVTYVNSERTSYPISSPDGTSFIIVAGNDGTLAAIPPSSFAPSITTLPTISGTLNVGETLTATAGTTSGVPTPTRVLQWQRSDDGLTGWADIAGATGTTYLLAFNDEDKYIRVEQTEENILGTATANSASTTQIQPVAFSGLLDDYPNAAAAYSLRKLRALYSGSAIKVRRDSDQALQDIGFNSLTNELDVATLESFCSGTDGFVHTWYDQSGNGYNATQTTASNQPKIVSNGSTITDNGKLAIDFNSSVLQSSSLFECNYISFVSTDSGNSLSQRFNPTEQQYNWGLANVSNSKSIVIYNPSFSYYTSLDAYSNSQSLNTIQSEDVELFKNGSSILDTAQNVVLGASPNIEKLNIGAYGNNGFYSYFVGKFQEVIVYDSDQSTNRTGIETNINNFYSIY